MEKSVELAGDWHVFIGTITISSEKKVNLNVTIMSKIKNMKYFEKKKSLKKCGKNDVKVGVGKIKIKTWFVCFFKCSLNFRAHALPSELSQVSISNFLMFQLQSMSSKIERAFEKMNIIFHQIRAKQNISACYIWREKNISNMPLVYFDAFPCVWTDCEEEKIISMRIFLFKVTLGISMGNKLEKQQNIFLKALSDCKV